MHTQNPRGTTTHTNRSDRARWMATVCIAMALATSLAACGSSDSKAADAKTAAVRTDGSSTSKPSTKPASTPEFTSFCDTWLKVDAVPSPGGPGGPPPADEVKAYANAVKPLAAALAAETPPEMVEPLKVLTAGVESAAQSGTTDSMEADDFGMASAVGEKWIHENCGYQNFDITAIDYAYGGVPATMSAGKTSLMLTNETKHDEMHEMIIFKRKAGVTEPAKDLLALPEDQTFSKVDFIGAILVPVGQSNGTTVDFVPGDYIAVCFLPVDGKESNSPHFMEGMMAEFKVA